MHDLIRPYMEKGLIKYQQHPTRDLHLYNYSELCQFENAWDEVTTMCRGLILNGAGEIVARPLKKFMNYEQHQGPIPSSEPEIYEKMDGSLLIVALESGYAPIFATRGSFTSEQAIEGEQIMFDKYGPPTAWMEPGWTYCFEVIYPENRIVVDYGDRRDVVLLAKINTETGEEQDIYFGVPEWDGPRAVRTIPFDEVSIEDLQSQNLANHEGYVLFWREEGLRLKIKFADYVRLHKLMTGVNARNVWEFLRAGQSLAPLVERVPDEFHEFVRETHDELLLDFVNIEGEARLAFNFRPVTENRRDYAAWVQTQREHIRPLLFAMLDGKPFDQIIWKQLKPEPTRPFWGGDEDRPPPDPLTKTIRALVPTLRDLGIDVPKSLL